MRRPLARRRCGIWHPNTGTLILLQVSLHHDLVIAAFTFLTPARPTHTSRPAGHIRETSRDVPSP